MKFKKGDRVRFTKEGWNDENEDYPRYFEGASSNLLVRDGEVNKLGDIEVFIHDKHDWHYANVKHIELDKHDPKNPLAWKRNKPLKVTLASGTGDYIKRHFSHITPSGDIFVFIDGYTSYTAIANTKGNRITAKVKEYKIPTKEELA